VAIYPQAHRRRTERAGTGEYRPSLAGIFSQIAATIQTARLLIRLDFPDCYGGPDYPEPRVSLAVRD
jgi:hypothetical protein